MFQRQLVKRGFCTILLETYIDHDASFVDSFLKRLMTNLDFCLVAFNFHFRLYVNARDESLYFLPISDFLLNFINYFIESVFRRIRVKCITGKSSLKIRKKYRSTKKSRKLTLEYFARICKCRSRNCCRYSCAAVLESFSCRNQTS